MARRLTITLDDELEAAISEAPKNLGLDDGSSDAERLREYARRGFEAVLEEQHERERMKTYREWASDPEMGVVAEAALRSAVRHGLFRD
jgi:hypothetical protein